ncbi:MAG TPA: PEGA domain-containing protein [Polyangiaceae bacterium]|nr:PEGA domain-containing protein [Polyangiaceae bacterium]
MREARARVGSWVGKVLFLACVLSIFPVFEAAAAGGKAGAQAFEAMRRRMETGLALFVGGKAAEAAAEFDAGYAEHPYSAFLFNAGVCYQKLGQNDKALERYREYMKIDPGAPDADTVQKRIAQLESLSAPPPPPPPPTPGGENPPPPPPPPPPEQIASTEEVMRSLVVVETEPPGAPIRVFAADSESTPAFAAGTPNAGWKQVASTTSPSSLSLAVGRYHVVIDKFRDFNASETDIKVSAGHVLNFKANLSQGVFMSFLRVSANVTGAHVWIDDEKKERPEWGTTPYGELVSSGEHQILVETPGFQPLRTRVSLDHGEQKELEVRLARVDYGVLRIDTDSAGAKVRVDSEPKGIWKSGEPPLDVQVASGKHHLEVEDEGRKTYSAMVDVPKGQILPIHAKLIPKYPRGGAWTQAIIAGVLIGASGFFGAESDKLYNQAKSDREKGVLDDSDGRITRGRIYAIGADCGFVAGGVLAGLATYNFIKDPMPESSAKVDKPLEFEDTLKARPTSLSPRERRDRVAERARFRSVPPAASFVAGPSAAGSGAGFVIGGTF